MVLPMNKEIRNYKQKIFFGLTVRRFIFLVLACVTGVITYLSIRSFVPMDGRTWITGAVVIPIAFLGFAEPYGMPLEKFIVMWFRNTILTPKHLVFKANTLYQEIEEEYEKREKAKKKSVRFLKEKKQSKTGTKKSRLILIAVICIGLAFLVIGNKVGLFSQKQDVASATSQNTGNTIVNDNKPNDLEALNLTGSFTDIKPLDDLGRATGVVACIDKDTVKQSETNINPTGFKQAYYSFLENGGELYKVCNLVKAIGNTKENCFTGTYYMAKNMEAYEKQISEAVNNNHRVIVSAAPNFTGNNLVCDSVQLQAYSADDNGESVKFNVIIYNTQPNVEIDYSTGDSVAN